MSRTVTTAVAALALAAAGAVAVPTVTADAATVKCTSANTETIGYGLWGSSLVVPRNGCLRIALVTHSDGGYYWRTTKAPAKSVLAGVSRTQRYTAGQVGGNSVTYYLYRNAARPGSTSLQLAEHQGTTARKGDWIFDLTVRVR